VLELTILTGKQAGAVAVARRFPFLIGRSPQARLRLEEAGVFERHAEIQLDPAQGFCLVAQPGAIVSVNGQPVGQARLRAGDIFELGSARLRFQLGPVPQRGLRWRETLTWVMLIALCLAQVAIIYGLMYWAGE
jgi:pSer/pThr/pTyr-binding forkhead associated (FHA) protein